MSNLNSRTRGFVGINRVKHFGGAEPKYGTMESKHKVDLKGKVLTSKKNK